VDDRSTQSSAGPTTCWVGDPVEPWADAVEAALAERGVAAPARVLDAGCGTGRHAAELAAADRQLVVATRA
jgi:hypothetical protein